MKYGWEDLFNGKQVHVLCLQPMCVCVEWLYFALGFACSLCVWGGGPCVLEALMSWPAQAQGQAPGPGPDQRQAYWLETSKTGDCWLFFKEGHLFVYICIAKGVVVIEEN